MALKSLITLPPELRERCRNCANEMLDSFKQPGTIGDAMSATLSSHGAEKNFQLQAQAKMAECAACLACGLNPELSLSWTHADSGYDFVFWGKKIDVKWGPPNAQFLIWPINKRHLLTRKHFDALLLVVGLEPHFEIFNWTTKQKFIERHKVADSFHKLTEGTWYMERHQLEPLSTFEKWAVERAQISAVA